MTEIKGGVCAPQGFKAAGVHAGVKTSSKADRKDLALIVSDAPCVSAAMFTGNVVKAAPVLVTREIAAGGCIRAVIANSGNANACTGQQGLDDARRMAGLAASALGLDAGKNLVAVASTGVIGVPLPLQVIEKAIPGLAGKREASAQASDAAVDAIMTTDTRRKSIAVETSIGSKTVHIGAIVKGSGMIHPNLGTMLCFITTDAAIERPALNKALHRAVERSFNRLTVDGDTSTNDTVLIMANGLAGNSPVIEETENEFSRALDYVCKSLAAKMARDGEGASKLITVRVEGAASEGDAAVLARSVAGSSLVKAAMFGADANWGRILCALGYAGVGFDPALVSVSFLGNTQDEMLPVFKEGKPLPFDETRAKALLTRDSVTIMIRMGAGSGTAEAWGCDLTYNYVKINGDYRT